MRSDFIRLPMPTARARGFPAAHPQPSQALTACELQLAADLQMAVGNAVRAELLSWAAHEARAFSLHASTEPVR